MVINDENNTEKNNYPDYIEKVFVFDIPRNQQPERLDQFITRSVIHATRNKVQNAIEAGLVTVNGKAAKVSRKIQPGDHVECKLLKPPPIELVPENIPLEIAFEDDFLLVVNKPPGMCSHPGFGNRYGTLVNAVLYHLGFRESLPLEYDSDNEEDDDTEISEGEIFASEGVRPGIVHRLDKDTSGLLVIAKNPEIHAKIAVQFAERTTDREYNAVVWGIPKQDKGTITGDIGRSPRDRKLFAIVKKDGKHAVTDYEVIEKYEFASLLKFKLHTGRTHQIRVHASSIGHPVFGDTFYGGDSIVCGGNIPSFKRLGEKTLKTATRQLLHARTLGFTHPVTKERLTFQSVLPDDMAKIISLLKQK